MTNEVKWSKVKFRNQGHKAENRLMVKLSPTNRDHFYITPEIKSMLQRKNKLMRAGRVEEAAVLSVRVGQAIQRHCRTQSRQVDDKTEAKRMWAAVRQLTGRQQTIQPVSTELLRRG